MLGACQEHLEYVLDLFIERYNEPPDFYLREQLEEKEGLPPLKCTCCEREARFVLKTYAD